MKNTLHVLLTAALLHVCGRSDDLPAPAPTIGKVISFGDEIASQIAPALGSYLRTNVVDRGVTNNTSEHAIERLKMDVLAHSPNYVVVILGGHDERNPLLTSRTRRYLYEIVRQIQDFGSIPILVDVGVEDTNDPIHSEVKRYFAPLWVEDIFKGIQNPYISGVYPGKEVYTSIASRVADTILKHAVSGLSPIAPILTIVPVTTDGGFMIGWWAHKGVFYELLETDSLGGWKSHPSILRDRDVPILFKIPSNNFTQRFFKVRATRMQITP